MLPAAFDRTALACTEELRAISPARAEVKYLGLDSSRVVDILDTRGRECVTGMLHAVAWDAHLLVSFDREILLTYVDLVFGGDGTQSQVTEQRPLSRIEMRIAETLLARVATVLSRGFAQFAPSSFAREGELGRADPDRLGGRKAAIATARFRLEAASSGGEMRVAIPDTVLTALKPAFARPPPGGAGAADPGWTQQIHSEINRTRLSMRAILEDRQRPLAEIAALRVGQILPLNATPRSGVRLDCNGEPLLWCEFGQSNGNYTVRVHGFVDREQEFMEGLLSG